MWMIPVKIVLSRRSRSSTSRYSWTWQTEINEIIEDAFFEYCGIGSFLKWIVHKFRWIVISDSDSDEEEV